MFITETASETTVYEQEAILLTYKVYTLVNLRQLRGDMPKPVSYTHLATLAFSAIQNNDKSGVIFFSDRIEKFIPPKKGRKHIDVYKRQE